MFRLRRWPTGLRTFVQRWLDIQFEVYCIRLWPVAEVVQRDQYGMAKDDPDCTLDDSEDYVDYLPEDVRVDATAMRYAGYWNMTPDAVLDMALETYHRRAMVHKAISLRKPQYTKDDWFMERTSSKFNKRKLKHRR